MSIERARILVLCGTVALGACAKQDAAPSPAAPLKPVGATLSVAGQLLSGDDPRALRDYLKSVKEIQPTKFEVKWSPAMVAFDKEAAIRSLRAISRDGRIYTLASAEPAVAKLKPGSILWIYDVALMQVTEIRAEGDSTDVRTEPVMLTAAMSQAQIEFDAPVSSPNYYMSFRPHRAPAPSARLLSSRSPYAKVMYWNTEPQAPNTSNPDPDSSDEDGGDYGEVRPAMGGYSGNMKGFDYSVGYSTTNSGVSLTLQARKSEESGGAAADAVKSEAELAKKFKEAAQQKKEAEQEVKKIKQELYDEQKDLNALDAQYQQQMAQLKADQAARKDPNNLGGTPGPRTDSNGTPYTGQAEQQILTRQYDQQRSLEVKKMLAAQQIRDAALKKKQDAAERERALAQLGGIAKKLFDVVSENVDIRFKVKVDIDNIALNGAIHIEDGNLDSAMAQFKHLNGTVALSFIGRMGKPGNGTAKIPLMDVPIVFNIPFPIGGIPFVIQAGADFNINVFLAGNHAAMKFNGSYAFTGSGGFHATQSGAEADSTMSGEEPKMADREAMSPGVSGAVLGIQAPRLGLGLGLLGASSVAYIDVVHVMTITNSAAVAAGMLAPPCKRFSYNAVGHVGVETKIMPLPIPFIADKINEKLSNKKEIFNTEKKELDPPIKACEV